MIWCKVAPPFKQAEFQILYGTGINRMGEVVDYGVKLGLIDKAGACGIAIRAVKSAKAKTM